MKNNQSENPLKLIEEQINGLLFIEEKEIKITKQTTNKTTEHPKNSIYEIKKHLKTLINELKNKKLHLVA